MSKVLIIEDEKGLQMTIDDRLTSEGYFVTICGDGLTGQEEALNSNYDIILLDIMLPGRDGYTVCSNIRKAGVATPILMLTARNSNLDIVLGLREGADDYLAKPFDMQVLLARIEALLRRSSIPKSKVKKECIEFGEFVLDTGKGELCKNDMIIELNAKEFLLLEFLVKNNNMIITRNRLMDEVWGYDSESSSRTVDVHIAKLRSRLEESLVPRHILTVRGRGYRFCL